MSTLSTPERLLTPPRALFGSRKPRTPLSTQPAKRGAPKKKVSPLKKDRSHVKIMLKKDDSWTEALRGCMLGMRQAGVPWPDLSHIFSRDEKTLRDMWDSFEETGILEGKPRGFAKYRIEHDDDEDDDEEEEEEEDEVDSEEDEEDQQPKPINPRQIRIPYTCHIDGLPKHDVWDRAEFIAELGTQKHDHGRSMKYPTLKSLQRVLRKEVKVYVSIATIQRDLEEQEVIRVKGTTKQCLTEKAKETRFQWCCENRFWVPWEKIFWSDESTFHNNIDPRKQFFRIKKGDERPVYRKSQGASRCMVMGFIFHDGTRELFDLGDKRVNGDDVLEKIQTFAKKHLRTKTQKEKAWLMLDGATTHNKSFRWCEENGIKVWRQPPYSPDLNPIENIWAIMKKQWNDLLLARGTIPKKEMFTEIKKIWDGLDNDMIQRTIQSVDDRVTEVVLAEGDKCSY